MNRYLSIISLSVNRLNGPIKRYRIAECIRKDDPYICCLQETHLRTKDLHRLKVKGSKHIFQANTEKKKKAGVTMLISDKIDYKKGAIKRDPEGHFLIFKGRIHQEDINIINIYAPNIGKTKYIRKILEDFKKDIDSNTLIKGVLHSIVNSVQIFSSQRSKIYILFECTWNIFKDIPPDRTQRKPQQIQQN